MPERGYLYTQIYINPYNRTTDWHYILYTVCNELNTMEYVLLLLLLLALSFRERYETIRLLHNHNIMCVYGPTGVLLYECKYRCTRYRQTIYVWYTYSCCSIYIYILYAAQVHNISIMIIILQIPCKHYEIDFVAQLQ